MKKRALIICFTVLGIFSIVPTADCEESNEFAGIGFGVGVSLTVDTGDHNRIESATLDANGIVRVEKERNDIPRVMLESHYFFLPKFHFIEVDPENWGVGPFVALQPGSNQFIEAIGMGIMLGFKRSKDPGDSSSWNFGIGAVVDPNSKILGDGIEENRPLPAGETEIRYKETSQWGVLFLASFTF